MDRSNRFHSLFNLALQYDKLFNQILFQIFLDINFAFCCVPNFFQTS